MKKILVLTLLLFFISNIYSDDILNELMEKLNNPIYYKIGDGDKEAILQNKLYLISEFIKGGNDIRYYPDSKLLGIHIDSDPVGFGIVDFKVTKIDNKYILEGTWVFNSKKVGNIKLEFIFDKNFLTIIITSDIYESYLYYIDENNDLEARYYEQKKNYFYNLVKDSKNSEIKLTKENKIEYGGNIFDYDIEYIYPYDDKFVLIFGEYEIPVEIVNKSIKVIKNRKLNRVPPLFHYELE